MEGTCRNAAAALSAAMLMGCMALGVVYFSSDDTGGMSSLEALSSKFSSSPGGMVEGAGAASAAAQVKLAALRLPRGVQR